ncbi:MAG: hypothetical protein GXY15_09745 [Candidatus Hydrogenedentes bacterium]|nr:hypothetical protein [Candidatus Hydrogenedentota bacterium]
MDFYCGKCGTEFGAEEAHVTRGLCPFCGVSLESTPPPPRGAIDVTAEPVAGPDPEPVCGPPAAPLRDTPPPPQEDTAFWYWRASTQDRPRSSCGCCGCLPVLLLFLLLALLLF